MAILADEEGELEQRQNKIKEELNVGKWLSSQPISSEEDIAKNLSSEFNINLSQAKKQLESFPNEYTIQNKSIPEVVKELRIHRRTLKGDYREKMTKSIETLVFAYSEHLDSCIKSIYWLSPYEYPLKNMRYVEQDLKKLHSIKDVDTRREIVDTLCKFWELDLERKETGYTSNYSKLSKEMTKTKKEFRTIVKSINNSNIKKSLKIQSEEFILNKVCEKPGISSREIHDAMPSKLYKRNSSHIISKMMRNLDITTIEGKHFK